MKRTEIAAVYADAEALAEQSVQVCGWVRTLRKSKGLSFVELNDGSCLRNLQIVAEEAKLANFDELCRQNVGAALCVTGRLLLTPEAKQFIIDAAYDPQFGARPLRRYVQHTVETLLAKKIVEGSILPGATITVDVENGELALR